VAFTYGALALSHTSSVSYKTRYIWPLSLISIQ